MYFFIATLILVVLLLLFFYALENSDAAFLMFFITCFYGVAFFGAIPCSTTERVEQSPAKYEYGRVSDTLIIKGEGLTLELSDAKTYNSFCPENFDVVVETGFNKYNCQSYRKLKVEQKLKK